MKKSVEILGLPIISITEGCELGMSKTLLIDAKNGLVAAITIEDEDWYRGVKLIPYESVIAIGDDAVTVTNSENILKLDEAGDYENLLDENIRVIGTKAITKNGTIQGKISELFIGDSGKIEKCEITAPDGTTSEVTAEQISIFGKQVTVIDAEKKTEFITEIPAPEPVQAEEKFTETASNDVLDFGAVSVPEEVQPAEEIPAALESAMTPEPTFEQPEEITAAEEIPAVEEVTPVIEEIPAVEEVAPVIEEEIPAVEEVTPVIEEIPAVEEVAPVVEEEIPAVEEVAPVIEEEIPAVEEVAPVIEEEIPAVEEVAPVIEEIPAVEEVAPVIEEVPAVEEVVPVIEEIPAVEEVAPVEEEIPAVEEVAPVIEEEIPSPVQQEDKSAATLTQQAEALKAALKRAMANQQKAAAKTEPPAQPTTATEKAVDDRRRRLLLGKKAARTIKADNGIVIVEEGADITEEVLQKAKLANKFMDLSMNYI